MKKNDPESIADVLAKLKREGQLGEQLKQAEIWEHWPDFAGAHLSSHGQPLGIREGTLYVEADSAVWMHRFSYHKWRIIGKINGFARHELVSDIFIRLKEEEEPPPPQDSV